MKSQTSLIASQCRLQQWTKQIHDCQNRPADMQVTEWCEMNVSVKSGAYDRHTLTLLLKVLWLYRCFGHEDKIWEKQQKNSGISGVKNLVKKEKENIVKIIE